MKLRRSEVALAASLALGALATAAGAQTSSEPLASVVVTGIRASLAKSIETKKNADANVEVVTAEDIGKMPDKNIADALSRLTGVSVQAGAANAMDEAERVAIRGTSPNLNVFTVNGHNISSGDWHVSDQGSSGRSVGFGLLSSQLIGQAIVQKTGQADAVEGGVAGSIDMKLRRPLDFGKPWTGEIAVGAVYADRPQKVDPQLSGLLAWQSLDKTLGMMVQVFSEDRHLRRDGQETFNRGTVSASQASAAGDASLSGALYPNQFGAALFEGVRKRKGGYLGVQFQPSKDTDINLSTFQATLNAENVNANAYVTVNELLANGYVIKNPTVSNGILTGATLTRTAAAPANTGALYFDQINRNGAESKSAFTDLDVSHRVNADLLIKGRVGTTNGTGVTPRQPWITLGLFNPQTLSYKLNPDGAASYGFTDAGGNPIDLANIANYKLINGPAAAIDSSDKEDYLHLDAEHAVNWGAISKVKFGTRLSRHNRVYSIYSGRWNAQDNGASGFSTPLASGGYNFVNLPSGASYPAPAGAYPADFGSGLNGAFPTAYPLFSPSQLQAFADQHENSDPLNKVWTSGYGVQESNRALYAMAEFEQGDFSGNFGVRAVTTKVTSTSYTRVGNTGCEANTAACMLPGVITGYRNGTYIPQVTETSHDTVLPSLNLRWQVRGDLIARMGASRTMGRANYNELAGAVSLNNNTLTATAGNPSLKPIVSNNLDLSLGWYFKPRAYVYGALFKQDMKDFVGSGLASLEFLNTSTGLPATYATTTKVGVDAQVKGAELAFEMPIGAGFGVGANYTYVDSSDASTVPAIQMVSTSRQTYNLVGFYENDRFSLRAAWNQRSDYPYVKSGTIVRWFDGVGTLSLSINYKFDERFSVSIDGNNLNDPLRLGYHETENLPANWYKSGRQYYVNLRAKF